MPKLIQGIDVDPLLLAHQSFLDAMGQVVNDLARDGAIQRFEYTFELSWKTMRRFLRGKGSEVNHPRDVFREAAAEGFIADPVPWFTFLEMRNKSTHIYKREVAEQVFSVLPDFAEAMRDFLGRINP